VIVHDAELFTDLYELTMLQAYFNEGMREEAVFDLFVRRLPRQRNFLVACGLEQVLAYLEALHFSAASLAHLASLGLFTEPFLDHLAGFRFTGSVRAVPEGTIVFAGEPLLEVTAPLPEAQLVETYLLNQLTFGTMVASKAARAVIAAAGRRLVDFGSRRAHGTDAAMKAARAMYIAGYEATSNVLAGREYGIPVAGTMAHSYVQAHDSETAAFAAFLRSFPETTLLVDTYDTCEGVRRAAQAAKAVGAGRLRAIRLDSGDLAALAKQARAVLDQEGLTGVGIFASGGLDEYEIAALLAAGAPIDGFGVGTEAVVSGDAPSLDSAYKLVSYAGHGRVKLAAEKRTLPGRKQVWRRLAGGRMAGDTVALADEPGDGEPLLVEVMRDGEVTRRESIDAARARVREQLARLPDGLRTLDPAAAPYTVGVSDALQAAFERARAAAAGA
jgi:nicotinate phosphoribosyltransferase